MSLRFENQPTCPVCTSPPDERRYSSMPYGIPVEYSHCPDCGILWQMSRLADDYLEEYYRDIYRQLTAPHEANRTQTAKVGHMRAKIQSEWLAQFTLNCDTALDYGCSGGWLMDALAGLGLSVVGVEMDKSELTAPARKKYTVYDCIEDAPGKYDLITLSHVVEHFNHPVEQMRAIADKLKPGGLLFVDVPNYRGLPGFGMQLHHPISYDAASLSRMLGMAGFETTEYTFYDWDNTPMDKYLMMAATKRQRKAKHARN